MGEPVLGRRPAQAGIPPRGDPPWDAAAPAGARRPPAPRPRTSAACRRAVMASSISSPSSPPVAKKEMRTQHQRGRSRRDARGAGAAEPPAPAAALLFQVFDTSSPRPAVVRVRRTGCTCTGAPLQPGTRGGLSRAAARRPGLGVRALLLLLRPRAPGWPARRRPQRGGGARRASCRVGVKSNQ